MKRIIRVYQWIDGKEVCHHDPNVIARLILETKVELDIDYFKENGHAKIGSSRDLIGEKVKIGEKVFEVPEH